MRRLRRDYGLFLELLHNVLINNNTCDIFIYMNDLHVAHYDEKEVEAKKQSLIKRLAVAGSVIVISMGLFNSCGGAGAWFISCAVEECECTECECTNNDCNLTKNK